MPKKKKMPEMILTYDERTEFFDSYEDNEDYTEETLYWHPLRVYLDEPSKSARDKANCWKVESLLYRDEFKVGDAVWLLVVRYTDGGSFGCTHGKWHIEDILTNEKEALGIIELIEADEIVSKDWNLSHPSYLRTKKDKPPENKYKSGEYKCWQGHFAHLDSVETYEMKIE